MRSLRVIGMFGFLVLALVPAAFASSNAAKAPPLPALATNLGGGMLVGNPNTPAASKQARVTSSAHPLTPWTGYGRSRGPRCRSSVRGRQSVARP